MLALPLSRFAYLLAGLVSMLAACGRPSPHDGSREEQATPVEVGPTLPQGTVVEVGEDSGSVVYRYGDFRLDGAKGMRFCVIRNDIADPPDALWACPDTLFADSTLILMGHQGVLNYEGVFKRYEPQYHPAEFPADALYHGPLADPDLRTDANARHFKTRIREGCEEEGVNFGGHYTITEWGCGHVCQLMALVDRKDGHVYLSDIPFDTLDGHHGLAFNPTSYLLEVNTAATDRIPGYSVVYWRKPATYLWNEGDRRFTLLQTMRWPRK